MPRPLSRTANVMAACKESVFNQKPVQTEPTTSQPLKIKLLSLIHNAGNTI